MKAQHTNQEGLMRNSHQENSMLVLPLILGFFLLLTIPHAISLAQVTTHSLA